MGISIGLTWNEVIMSELIKDGLAIKLTNGVNIPLEYGKIITFYTGNKERVLNGSLQAEYDEGVRTGRYHHVDFDVKNYGDGSTLNQIYQWFRESGIYSVRVWLRGWDSSLIFNLKEVASFDFYYKNPNPQGIQVLLKGGKRLLLEKGQHIVFYSCPVDEVEDDLESFKINDAPWNDPVEFSLDYNEDIYTVGLLNRWGRGFGSAKSVSINLMGDGGQNLYKTSDFEYFELV